MQDDIDIKKIHYLDYVRQEKLLGCLTVASLLTALVWFIPDVFLWVLGVLLALALVRSYRVIGNFPHYFLFCVYLMFIGFFISIAYLVIWGGFNLFGLNWWYVACLSHSELALLNEVVDFGSYALEECFGIDWLYLTALMLSVFFGLVSYIKDLFFEKRLDVDSSYLKKKSKEKYIEFYILSLMVWSLPAIILLTIFEWSFAGLIHADLSPFSYRFMSDSGRQQFAIVLMPIGILSVYAIFFKSILLAFFWGKRKIFR